VKGAFFNIENFIFQVGDVGKRTSEDGLKKPKVLGFYDSFTNSSFIFPSPMILI